MTTINSVCLTVSEPFNLSAAAEQKDGSPLLYLHPQQIQHIFSFLTNPKDGASLACTCKRIYQVLRSYQLTLDQIPPELLEHIFYFLSTNPKDCANFERNLRSNF